MKLFISQTSFLREESEARLNKLEEIGISRRMPLAESNLSDEDIEWTPITIPYSMITYSYPSDEGFQVGVLGDRSFFCKHDPFAVDKE